MQSNIILFIQLLNHADKVMTLAYLGLNQVSMKTMLNQSDFS